MKKIKFLQAHLLFHSRNISGSQVEHSAAVFFFLFFFFLKTFFDLGKIRSLLLGQSSVDDGGVIMQITANYSG